MGRDTRDGRVARPSLGLTFATARESDAAAIAAVRSAAAEHLTEEFGGGHWSGLTSERGVLSAMRTSRVLVARRGREIVATLRLATKKPWAIDASYYTKVARPLYLTDMAVDPGIQRMGGRGRGRARVAGGRDPPRLLRRGGGRRAVLREVRVPRGGEGELSGEPVDLLRETLVRWSAEAQR
jgi:hypothetical protein